MFCFVLNVEFVRAQVLISPWVDFEEDEETAKPGGSFKRFGHVRWIRSSLC